MNISKKNKIRFWWIGAINIGMGLVYMIIPVTAVAIFIDEAYLSWPALEVLILGSFLAVSHILTGWGTMALKSKFIKGLYMIAMLNMFIVPIGTIVGIISLILLEKTKFREIT